MRLWDTWRAVEADCWHYRWFLDDPLPGDDVAEQAQGEIAERWPRLLEWFEAALAKAPDESLGDAPPDVLAEADAIRATFIRGVGTFEGAERLVVAWAHFASSFAITLTRGVGCRFEHPAYARNG
jgi:hypothetical protein